MNKTCKTLTTIISVIIIFNLFVSSALSQSFIQGRFWGDNRTDMGVRLYTTSSCGGDEEVGIPQLSNTLGYYAWEGLPSGQYKVVPEHDDYNFIPEFRIVQIPQPELNSYNFKAEYTCAGGGNERFVDNNDGTVTDSCTGNIWLRDRSCGDNELLIVSDWINYLSDGECELTDGSAAGDWRIPTRGELTALGTAEYGLYPEGWEGVVPADISWKQPEDPFVWCDICETLRYITNPDGDLMNILSGSTELLDPSDITQLVSVWPVRDPPPPPPSCANGASFEDNGDGTVTDCRTDLVWLQDAGCGWGLYWDDAMSYADGLNSGECGLTDGSAEGDWHLATIYELQGIGTDPPTSWYPFPTPSVTWTMPGDPFQDVLGKIDSFQFYYWSSTEEVGTTEAWVSQMNDGFSYPAEKEAGQGRAWPVRSAN